LARGKKAKTTDQLDDVAIDGCKTYARFSFDSAAWVPNTSAILLAKNDGGSRFK